EVAQSHNGKKHSAGGEDGNIPAEYQNRKLPRNFMQNGKHKEHRAEQKFIGDGIEILPQQSLLMQFAGKQSVKPVAETGDYKKHQRPEIMAVRQFDDDERNENHAQQRE